MKLNDWLQHNQVSQAEFARQTALNPSTISRLCGDDPRWPPRWVMQKLYHATKRKVTPLDYLFPNQERPTDD